MTGADSPVMADSSTDAMPSIAFVGFESRSTLLPASVAAWVAMSGYQPATTTTTCSGAITPSTLIASIIIATAATTGAFVPPEPADSLRHTLAVTQE